MEKNVNFRCSEKIRIMISALSKKLGFTKSRLIRYLIRKEHKKIMKKEDFDQTKRS